MIRVGFFIFITILMCVPAHALRPGLTITQYSRSQWTTTANLASDTTTAIAQTRDGYMWFGTSGGLCRFNGIQATVFNMANTPALKSNNITSLLTDKNGSLWIGTEGGGLLNYDQDKFKTFTIDDGLSDNTILSLAQDHSGNLWVLTSIDVNIYNGKNFTQQSIQHPTALFADSDAVFIGTESGFTMVQKGKSIPHAGPRVTAINRGNKGEIWIGTTTGLYQWQDNKMVPRLDCEEIRSIHQDRDGNVWIGTMRGLRLLRKNSPLHSHIHNSVDSLFEDREGTIWVATTGEGIQAFYPSAVSVISADEGLITSRTLCVLQDHAGNLWMGTDDGVSRWFDQQITNFHLSSAAKTLVEDASGTIWAGTSAGILRFNNESFEMVYPGVHSSAMVVQKTGELWIGSIDGLHLVSQGKMTLLSPEEITALYIDPKGQLWAGTRSGLKFWKDGNLQSTPMTDEVFSIVSDQQGNIWAGSQSKIYSIRNKKLNSYSLGLGVDAAAAGIIQDAKGTFWIASTQGVLRGTMEKGQFCVNRLKVACASLNTDSMAGQPSILISENRNRFWVATLGGVAEVDAESLQQKKAPPPIMIERVERDRFGIENFRKEKLKFSTETKLIDFRFVTLSYIPGVKYRYVLQGYDQFWTDAGSQRHALYTNLPPGKYRFKVLAGRDDVWNIVGDSISFEIEGSRPGISRSSTLPLVILMTIIGFLAGWFARMYLVRKKTNLVF